MLFRSNHFILLIFLDTVPNYAQPYKSILFYSTSANWARFGPNGPVRSVFHKNETETSIFTSYLLISYFWFCLIRFGTMRYRTNQYYSIRRRPIRFVLAQMGPLDPFFTKLKLIFSHHIYSIHTFCFP